jgi:hypothetical protein
MIHFAALTLAPSVMKRHSACLRPSSHVMLSNSSKSGTADGSTFGRMPPVGGKTMLWRQPHVHFPDFPCGNAPRYFEELNKELFGPNAASREPLPVSDLACTRPILLPMALNGTPSPSPHLTKRTDPATGHDCVRSAKGLSRSCAHRLHRPAVMNAPSHSGRISCRARHLCSMRCLLFCQISR